MKRSISLSFTEPAAKKVEMRPAAGQSVFGKGVDMKFIGLAPFPHFSSKSRGKDGAWKSIAKAKML
jgi:hypothetical protein